MKQIIIFFIVILATISSVAQTVNRDELTQELKPLNEKVVALESTVATQRAEIRRLNQALLVANAKIDSLFILIQTNSKTISQTAQALDLKITNAETNTGAKISEVVHSLSNTTLWTMIGIVAAILIAGLVYWLLHQKQITDKTIIFNQLNETKSSIEESLINEFGKQTGLMDTQIELLKQQSAGLGNAEPDHSLALKVAGEINLIERNIALMDAGTRGLKQLTRSVEKLKDNLNANGYEMPQLIGKPFHQGMKVIVTSSIPDENLEQGTEIITKVLIPQVNYNGIMIQTAQIEVSVGY